MAFSKKSISIRVLVFTLATSFVGSAAMLFGEGEPTVYVCPPCGCSLDQKSFDKPGTCPECRMGLVRKTAKRAPRNVGIVVYQGVEVLDFAGPTEAFSSAMGSNGDEYQVFTVATTTETVDSNRSELILRPEYTIENHPKLDVVVIPGGRIDNLLRDLKFMEWVKARAADTEVLMSVCNGVFVLHKAGLLEGLEATTHHDSIEMLRRTATNTKVVTDRRYVDNGRVITAAGVSAGIDAALHVVERFYGPEVADNTARYMEYTRNKSTGNTNLNK